MTTPEPGQEDVPHRGRVHVRFQEPWLGQQAISPNPKV